MIISIFIFIAVFLAVVGSISYYFSVKEIPVLFKELPVGTNAETKLFDGITITLRTRVSTIPLLVEQYYDYKTMANFYKSIRIKFDKKYRMKQEIRGKAIGIAAQPMFIRYLIANNIFVYANFSSIKQAINGAAFDLINYYSDFAGYSIEDVTYMIQKELHTFASVWVVDNEEVLSDFLVKNAKAYQEHYTTYAAEKYGEK